MKEVKRFAERVFVGEIISECIDGEIPIEPEWWWDILAEYYTA
jgi:hypothetical protein